VTVLLFKQFEMSLFTRTDLNSVGKIIMDSVFPYNIYIICFKSKINKWLIMKSTAVVWPLVMKKTGTVQQKQWGIECFYYTCD